MVILFPKNYRPISLSSIYNLRFQSLYITNLFNLLTKIIYYINNITSNMVFEANTARNMQYQILLMKYSAAAIWTAESVHARGNPFNQTFRKFRSKTMDRLVGSISATFSSPVYVPHREETAGRVSGKACL